MILHLEIFEIGAYILPGLTTRSYYRHISHLCCLHACMYTVSLCTVLWAVYINCFAHRRKHDLRLSLNSYNAVPHDDPTVQTFVKTAHLSENGDLTFVPQAYDKEWTTRMVRHKVRRAYHVGKKNYIATVTKVNSYEIAPADLWPQSLKQAELTIGGNDWKEHYEIEVISVLK